MSNSVDDFIDEDDELENLRPPSSNFEPEKKPTNYFAVVIVVILLLGVGFVCNHVQEEAQKLDTFTDLVLGTTIFGLICLCFYFYSKNK